MAKSISFQLTVSDKDVDYTSTVTFSSDSKKVSIKGDLFPSDLRLAHLLVRVIKEHGGYQKSSMGKQDAYDK